LNSDAVISGSEIRKSKIIEKISNEDLDYLICIHFPYIIPESILSIPKIGVLNLHPAYLPWNRGWHTPTWAIFDNTPFGATLHFMDNSLDTGDIIHEKKIPISPEDTADSLYQKVHDLEIEVFAEAFPKILQKNFTRIPQKKMKGSVHKKNDIKNIQRIDLNANAPIKDLIIKLKALTTNTLDEAAFFEENGEIYRVQIKIVKQDTKL
jgi:methionyl-tRNA formyltransferase